MQSLRQASTLPRFASLFAVLFATTLLAIAPASASGGGGSSSGGGNGGGAPSGPTLDNQPRSSDSTGTDMTTCPKGQIWSVKRKTCLRLRGEVMPDDAMTDYAYALAKADRYGEALEVLDLLTVQDTPKALNYRGYATRKLGRTDEGIGYYLRSVSLDPHYAQVREYLGEAYVIKGRIDLAKDQLETIKSLCGTECEPYRDLSEAIAEGSKI